MTTYTTRVRVPVNGPLVIELPPGLPAGDAEVSISPIAETRPRGMTGPELNAYFAERERAGWRGTGRTRQEVDAELSALRDEWDND